MTLNDLTPAGDGALVLLDFQFEFLDASGRMPVCRQHVTPTIDAALKAVEIFKKSGRPVAAIGNEFRRGDYFMNLLRRHASMKGSRGAIWDQRVPLDGLAYFPKWAESAFVNPEFETWLRREKVREIAICGMFASACVSSTAREALKKGYRVRLVSDAIACSNDRTKARSLARLRRKGALLAA